MPATREPSRSSTYCTIIASMNGIARTTTILNARAQAKSVQRVARPARQRGSPRDDEGHTPAGILDEEAGQESREGDAEIAGEAVDADGEAGVLRVLHDHGNADRVVDRREDSHDRERDGKRERPL